MAQCPYISWEWYGTLSLYFGTVVWHTVLTFRDEVVWYIVLIFRDRVVMADACRGNGHGGMMAPTYFFADVRLLARLGWLCISETDFTSKGNSLVQRIRTKGLDRGTKQIPRKTAKRYMA